MPCIGPDSSEESLRGWVKHVGLTARASILVGLCWETALWAYDSRAFAAWGNVVTQHTHASGWHLCVETHVSASGINSVFPLCTRLTGTRSDWRHALALVTSRLWGYFLHRSQENASQLCAVWQEDGNGNRARKHSPSPKENSGRAAP